MIKVKCPKCRLTFEVEALPGITEVACNCPRCGTPFTTQIQEAAASVIDSHPSSASPSANTHGYSSEVANVNTDKDQQGVGASGTSVSDDISSYNARLRDKQSVHRQQSFMGGNQGALTGGTSRHKTGCMGGCLMVFLICFLLFFWGVRQCSKSEGERYEPQDVSTTIESNADDGVEVGQGGKDTFVEVNVKEAPAWIQGSWLYDDNGTDGVGQVIIAIRGNHLTESIQGQNSAKGTFYYENGVLHFETDNGKGRCDYRLDVTGERIEWQDGKFMKKIR